jgi:isopenicillin-N epimerase
VPSPFAQHWTLEPGLAFLNHGSFGAAPRPVLEAQQAWRDRLEREPIRFLARDLEAHLDEARADLAAFVGADPDDLAFVPNATSGFNAVLRSLRFDPGDELLTTNHAYNAARNALEFVAERWGARVIVASVPFPIAASEEAEGAILDCVTSRTRLALLDHVTSATALVLPVERLVRALGERGIDTLVDGAHAAGMLELDLDELGAAYYTSNLHKWVCAPKGTGFLWVRRDRQVDIRPLAISHGANSSRIDRSRFRLEFDWTGTADPSAFLAIPDALQFGASLLPDGWAELRRRNHELAIDGRDLLCDALGVEHPAPDGMLGSMASVPLPREQPNGAVQGIDLYDDAVHAALLEEGIQVMVTPWPQRPDRGGWRRLIRLSAAAYNDRHDMVRLAQGARRLAAGVEPVAPRAAQPSPVQR